MSIALMTQVWKSTLPAGRKMVLLALCDNANDMGECFPSISMLAEKCSMGERTVQQHITDLESIGIVSREMRNGRSTLYRIDPRKFCTPAESAPPQNPRPTPAKSAPPPPQISHPTPADFAPITIKEPSIEPSRNRQKRAQAPRVALGLEDLIALGVESQVAEDWLAIRAKKRLPLTKTALEEVVAEVAAARMTLGDALRTCCKRGWAGFESAWMQPKPQQANGTRGYQGKNDRSGAAAAIFGSEEETEREFIDVN